MSIHFPLISFQFPSMSYDFASISFWSPFVSCHFFFISFHFGHSFPFMLHSCPILHSFPSTLTIIYFNIILFISFFPFLPCLYSFPCILHLFSFIFHSFPFNFDSYPFMLHSFPFILHPFPFILLWKSCRSPPDMAIENGNRAFYVQFLQPISLKESRKVPSVFALFMNIAIKRCIGSSAGNYACEKSVCAMLCVLYSMCIPSNHFLVNGSFV